MKRVPSCKILHTSFTSLFPPERETSFLSHFSQYTWTFGFCFGKRFEGHLRSVIRRTVWGNVFIADSKNDFSQFHTPVTFMSLIGCFNKIEKNSIALLGQRFIAPSASRWMSSSSMYVNQFTFVNFPLLFHLITTSKFFVRGLKVGMISILQTWLIEICW